MKCHLLFWISIFVAIIGTSSEYLRTLYEWGSIEIDKRINTNRNVFNPAKAVPYDVEVSSDGRTFLTVIPKANVMYTLLTVSTHNSPTNSGQKSQNHSLVFRPYPNAFWHAATPGVKDCQKLRSVSSIIADVCDRLWVVDSGRVEDVRECPAKLMVFNLRDDSLIRKWVIPKTVSEDLNGKSYLVNPTIHMNNSNCDHYSIFIADTVGKGIITFDGSIFRRYNGREFQPQYQRSKFEKSNESFLRSGGILPIDVGSKGKDVIFAPLASRSLYSLNARCLMSGSKPKPSGVNNLFDGQPTALRMSYETNAMFIALSTNKIVCWSKSSVLCKEDFITMLEKPDQSEYISTLKLIRAEQSKSGEEELLFLSQKLQNSPSNNRQSGGDINYRILKGNVKELIKNTRCERPPSKSCRRTFVGRISNEDVCP